jgi:predicted site-specific integrase-resolvase
VSAGRLLTVAEFGERIGVKPRTAQRIVKADKVDKVNVGSAKRPRYRISEAAAERYIAKNEKKARA